MKVEIKTKKQAQQMWNIINLINGMSMKTLSGIEPLEEQSKAVKHWLKESEQEFLDLEDIKRQLENYMYNKNGQ